MSRAQSFLVVVLSAALAIAAIVSLKRPADPVIDGRAASVWARDLLDSDYTVRGRAQTALLKLGEGAVPQVQVLLRRRRWPWEAALPRLSAVLPFLRSTGADPALCRQRAAEVIAALGPAGHAAVPDLVKTLAYGQAAPDAERALLRVGNSSVPGLVDGLSARNSEVRARSARLLKEFVNEPAQVVPALLTALSDDEFSVRRAAAGTLGALHSPNPTVIAGLLRLRSDPVAEVRASVFEALGKLGTKTTEVIAAIRQGMTDSIPLVRLEAAKACDVLTADRESAIAVLIGVLPTQEGWQAAYALGNMGPAAANAVPALIDVLKREKVPRAFRTPPSSSLALGQIQEPAVPALIEVLHYPDAGVRIAAVLALGFMGEHARPAIPALQALLTDSEPEVRQVTAITLATAGADRELVLATLPACLQAEDIYMRSTAAALLRKIAPEREWAASSE